MQQKVPNTKICTYSTDANNTLGFLLEKRWHLKVNASEYTIIFFKNKVHMDTDKDTNGNTDEGNKVQHI